MAWINRWTGTLWLQGVAYAPGATIPATVDPAQLAAFAAQGIIEPMTAPAPTPPPLRRVASRRAVKEVPDGDDRSV
jgi:hypothetical protein